MSDARYATPSDEIDAKIAALPDWRGDAFAHVRRLVLAADPGITEAVKWRKPSNGMSGTTVWEKNGILCTGEVYKGCVKLTFARGASLPDPAGLFNASLDGNARRAIDLREGYRLDEEAFAALVREAVVACGGRNRG